MSVLPLRRLWLSAKEKTVLGGAIAIGPPRPQVALTFDDGPDPTWTPAILDILAAHRVRATFFLLGTHLERAPALARQVAAEHEIGCHSYAHARRNVESLAAFRADVSRFRALADRELQREVRFYRFPWGERGRVRASDVLALERMRCVHWSASGGDDTLDADRIVARLSRLEPGAIVLLHDGVAPGSIRRLTRDETVRALPRVLGAIAARGLAPVTLSELLCVR